MQNRNKRAFILTADALLCFLIASTLLANTANPKNVNLNDEILYAQAQDIVEACTIINDLTPACFDAVKTEHVDYCLNDCKHPMIKRDYVEFGLILK